MANIVFDHVSKQFSDTSLNECTLEIQDKDFFVFAGPSSCGKSTALRCLQGLLDIDSGRILIDGQDVTTCTPMERNLREIGASYALYPKLTVFENLSFWLKKHNVPKSDITQQVQDVAEKLGLESLLKHKPNQLTILQGFGA